MTVGQTAVSRSGPQNTQYFTVSIPSNKLKVSGPYIDITPILDVAAQPRERIQVNGVNFIKLLLQSAISIS